MEALNLLDIIVIVSIIIGSFIGLSRGFVLTLLSFAGKLLSAFLAVKFLQPFMSYFKIKDLFLRNVVDFVIDYIPLSEELKGIQINEGVSNINQLGIEDNVLVKIMGDNISREIEGFYAIGEKIGLTTIGEMLSLVVANYIVNILSFIFLFFLFLIGFSILEKILVKIIGLSNLTLGIDKILGFFLGAAMDIFIISLIIGISFDILNLLALKDAGWLNKYKELLNQSYLQEHLYQIYSMIISEGTKLL